MERGGATVHGLFISLTDVAILHGHLPQMMSYL